MKRLFVIPAIMAVAAAALSVTGGVRAPPSLRHSPKRRWHSRGPPCASLSRSTGSRMSVVTRGLQSACTLNATSGTCVRATGSCGPPVTAAGRSASLIHIRPPGIRHSPTSSGLGAPPLSPDINGVPQSLILNGLPIYACLRVTKNQALRPPRIEKPLRFRSFKRHDPHASDNSSQVARALAQAPRAPVRAAPQRAMALSLSEPRGF